MTGKWDGAMSGRAAGDAVMSKCPEAASRTGEAARHGAAASRFTARPDALAAMAQQALFRTRSGGIETTTRTWC